MPESELTETGIAEKKVENTGFEPVSTVFHCILSAEHIGDRTSPSMLIPRKDYLTIYLSIYFT